MSHIPDCQMYVYVNNRKTPGGRFTLVEYVIVLIGQDTIILDQNHVGKVSIIIVFLKFKERGVEFEIVVVCDKSDYCDLKVQGTGDWV